MDDARRARAAAAKRPVKRAAGLLKEAARLLAEEADGADLLGSFDLTTGSDVEAAAAALTVALEQRGPMQIQIVAVPRRTPRPPRRGEGDQHVR